MSHIYLSPHLDDVVLSCGGTIHRQTSNGEPVQVITVFAGDAQDHPLSPFAQEQHDYWGNPPQPMALRRAEDTAALALLGADLRHLEYLDAVYRMTDGGEPLYADVEELLGSVVPADRLGQEGIGGLVDLLDDAIPSKDRSAIYAPLGAGCHVDHQIVSRAGRQLLARGYRVAFYEDYPYAEGAQAVESALTVAEGESWQAETIPLGADDLVAKVAALGYYHTQMTVLFGGSEAMPSRVWAFAATCSTGTGLGERIWWLPRG